MESENSMDSVSEDCFSSVKCKHNEFYGDTGLSIEEYTVPRVEVEDECSALHEMVTNQQMVIQNLMSELEEERNAAASAANEAMSMILRLQRDKAEIQMEAKQFKRLAEEKMSHNQHETSMLEELLYKRDQRILSLTSEIQSYRHLMSSYGISEAEGMSQNEFSEGVFAYPPYEMYPSLRCDEETGDMENYPFVETLHSMDQLKDLKSRIYQLENSNTAPGYPGGESTSMKNVIVSRSPGRLNHLRKLSIDSMSSPFAVNKEICTDFVLNSPRFDIDENCDFHEMDDDVEEAENGTTDRIYTVDSVFHGPVNPHMDPSVASPRGSLMYSDPRDLEIQKLYARVHALEADRESMKQAIISVSTNKAQMVLLKEIAQNLCKEISPAKRIPERKQPETMTLSLKSIFKWLLSSITFWRKKKHRRCRYMFEESAYSLLGLLILLESCQHRWRRCILKTDVLNNKSSPPKISM